MTITDADLERLLNLAAAEYAVPEDGIETVLAAERAPAPPKARAQRSWFAPRRLVVGFGALAILGVFIGGVVTNGGSTKHGASATSGVSPEVAAAQRTGPESMPKFPASSAVGGSSTLNTYSTDPTTGSLVQAPAGAPVPAAAAAGGTGTSPTGSGSAGGGAAADTAAAPLPSAAALQGLAATKGGTSAVKAADAGTADAAKIVRTGQADLTVAKGSVPKAQDTLEGLATSLGGYVANEKSSGGDYPSASVTIRVPGEKFSELVKQVQTIGTVAGLSTQAADVTSQYTDLSARIHALETQRDTYLTLLAKASSIQETLAVQQRVDAVQTQLEQLQGQQKVLDDQTSYGSLAVTVSQEGQPVIQTVIKPRDGFSKAWYDAKHRFNGGVEGLVAASGPVAFVAVLALVAWAVWLLVRRRLQRARV